MTLVFINFSGFAGGNEIVRRAVTFTSKEIGMKAEHILLLVLAGAVGGAGLMKLVQRPGPVAVAAVKAEAPLPPVAIAAPPVVVIPPDPPASARVEVALPPAPAVRPHAHVERVQRRAMPHMQAFAIKPSPVAPPRQVPIMAQVEPAPAPPPVEAPQAAPAPPPLPPARVEPDPVPAAPAPPPPPPTVTLNAGMLIPVRLVDGLSPERNAPGDAFAATLDSELVADGFVIAERGARVEGRVVAIGAALAIELTRLHTSDGQHVAIRTASFQKQKEPGDVLLIRKSAILPSETRISFRLSAPVTLTERQ